MNYCNAARPFFATRFLTCTGITGMLRFAAVCAGVFGCVAGVCAQTTGAVTAWGNNNFGQCDIPAAALSGVSAIAGNYARTIALKNGAVLSWGYDANNNFGQYAVPIAAQSGISAIACGFFHNLALKDGGVLTWGHTGYGSIPPTANSGVTAIAAYGFHSIALKGGAVVGWGDNNYGQSLGTNSNGAPITTTPQGQFVQIMGTVLQGVSAIACGWDYTIAIKNGAVLAWGNDISSQCNIPPAALTNVSAIACGSIHTIALKDGAVLAWGSNASGQCNIPAAANSGVTAIACGDSFSIALKNNGSVLSWGSMNTEQQPSNLGYCTKIAAGGDTCIAIQTPFADCNNNSTDDAIEIRDFALPDLNHDQVPDTCQGAIEYDITSASLGVPTANVAVSTTFTNLVMPDNFADVPVVISAKGDFDASNEFLTVKLNGVTMQRVLESGGVNCSTGTGISTATVQIPFATFANAVAVGQLTITLLPSPAVAASECGTGFMTVQLKYVGIGESGDCNNNGLLDTRDIGVNPSLDRNRNALLDACELNQNPLLDCNLNGELDSFDIAMGAPDDDLDTHPDQCQYDKGDFDLDGFVNSNDLGILLLYWLEIDPPFGDFNHDRTIDSSDLGGLLSKFGPVTWGAPAPVTEHANKPRDQQMR